MDPSINHAMKNLYERALSFWSETPEGKKLKSSVYRLCSPRLGPAGTRIRLIQLSDLHGRSFGVHQEELVRSVAVKKPDLIVFTGDAALDFYEKEEREATRVFFSEMTALAPVYAILGNHDTRSPKIDSIAADITESGAVLLRDEGVFFEKSGACLYLFGLECGRTSSYEPNHDDRICICRTLSEHFSGKAKERYRVLLAHKPEELSSYQLFGPDLVLSGHAHGGYIPLGKRHGIIAPGQGFFPSQVRGLHHLGDTAQIISEGLGGPRLGIHPEIVTVDLCGEG